MERCHNKFASEKMPDCLCQVTWGQLQLAQSNAANLASVGKSKADGLQHCPAQVLLASCLHGTRIRNKKGDHLLELMPWSGSVTVI